MPTLKQEHLEESLKKHKRRDPELYQELQEKLALSLDERVAETARTMGIVAEAPLAEVDGGATADGRRLVETIVQPNARPVLLIRNNRATTEFLGPDSQVWAGRIQTAQALLDSAIPAVGRVEVGNFPGAIWLGTGWLVAPEIVVTNRHVAREFGRRSANGFTFRVGSNGFPITSRVDFLEEFERSESLEYAVTSILWIAPTGEPDVAFLRVTQAAPRRSLPAPIALAAEVTEADFIAAIGYPARDSRVPDQDLVRSIFGDVYEKKRLAPGTVLEVKPDELEHDCSTLGGNSGSVLVNLRTGEAVGLHFAGLFLEANFAVPAPKVRELLRRVQQGELPGAITVRGGDAAVSPPEPAPAGFAPSTYTFQFQIPVEITVKVGGVALPATPTGLTPSVTSLTGSSSSSGSLDNAMRAMREALAGDSDVINIRTGYRFKRGWITDEQVVVVEVREKTGVSELQRAGKRLIPPQILGVGVDVRTAALPDQLEHLGVDLSVLEARARPGGYQEPRNLSLPLIRERMKVVFHVSPDSGFPNLKAFLGRVEKHLSATMYEWEPNHISDAIEAVMAPAGNTLTMVTQRGGTEVAVTDMQARIGNKFKHVWASVGAGKLIPRAYHIKVAVRDGKEIWLSSGNWKDSNQADIDPAGDNDTRIGPLRQHNREWHAVIANATLAKFFQQYIEFDFAEAQRVPLEEGVALAWPEVFVPEAAFLEEEARVRARYFKPLELNRELEIQPLLTPDRNRRGERLLLKHATQMIAQAQRKIYLQNQSFNLLEPDNNNEEFEHFFSVLHDKQQAGLDVRIIFRDAREFSASNGEQQQRLLERIKDFGIDTDFIRVQRRCHTKGIIVDSSEVLLGSHNLTNQGSLFNRDASLLVRDATVAAYFEQIFLFDWDTLATQQTDELIGGIRLAQADEATPMGFRRVSLAELSGEN